MKTEDLVLLALQDVLPSPDQMISVDYFWNHFPGNSRISYDALIETISILSNKGLVQTKKPGRRTLLIALTGDGKKYLGKLMEEKRQRKARLEKWGLLITIVSGIATIVAFFPGMVSYWEDWQQRRRPIEDYLIIQSVELQPDSSDSLIRPDFDLNNFDPLNQDFGEISIKCLSGSEECKMLLVDQSSVEPPRLRLQVTSNRADQPLSISGLELTVLQARDLSTSPLSEIVSVPCGGGGGYYPYRINDLETSATDQTKLPFVFNAKPQQAITAQDLVGKTVMAEPVCEGGSCDQFQYVTNQEVEGMELQMPFLESIPAGWYEFQVRPFYKYLLKEYFSSQIVVFDVIKPSTLRSWWQACERTLFPSFADRNLMDNSVVPNIVIPAMQNPPATMIINSLSAVENGYYSLDLQTGELRHMGGYAFAPSKLVRSIPPIPPEISLDGQIWAAEVQGHMPDTDDISSAIGILDIGKETFTTITPSDVHEHLSPSISPSGNEVAYVTYIDDLDTEELKKGEADIFIYDIRGQAHRRVTFTPGVIETEPTWVNDHLIAYLVPEIHVSGNTKSFDQPSLGAVTYDLMTGEEKVFSLDANSDAELIYLPSRGVLFVGDTLISSSTPGRPSWYLIDPNSGSLESVPLPPIQFDERGTCRIVDATSDLFICQDKYYRTAQLLKRTESGFLNYFEQATDDDYGLLVGNVLPNSLAIANIQSGVVVEFDKDGNVFRQWTVPQADRLLHFYAALFDPPEFVIIPKEDASQEVPPAITPVATTAPAEAFKIQERIIDASRPELNANLTFSVPWVTGSTQADRFNRLVQQYVDEELAKTLEFLKEPIDYSVGGMGINYIITSSNQWTAEETPFYFRKSSPLLSYDEASIKAGHDVISILFENGSYFGGVHPTTSHATLNFDFATGNKLELRDLFLAGTDYLSYISNYSIGELQKIKDELFEDFQKDAGPDEKNFQDWAITRYGILILFEEYQVAPYMSGPKFVVIPYDYLKPIINPQGPIGAYAY